MRLSTRIAITVAIALGTPLWTVGEEETIWTITMSHTRLEVPSGPIFDMRAIEYKSGELTATCTFANIESPKYQPVKVSIEGEWRDGFFWPVVKEQVGDLYLGPWYSMPGESKKGKLTKVDVLPGQEMRKWRVRLNDFLPYVGNYKVGRLVLNSGDFAVFELIKVKGETSK